ncbi:MAG: pantetheine-phosphate adenylyltransferase [Pseudomonadota bacterium]
MMIIAVYPGTFDPVTNGHMDIIYRSTKLFDHLIVAVASSKGKKPLFNANERIKMIEDAVQQHPCKKQISVLGFNSLLVDFCELHKATVILRGLRAVSDFEYEFQLSGMNKKLNKNIETLFLPTTEQNTYISSSMIKEVAQLGGEVDAFIPSNVRAELLLKMS